MIPDEEVLLPGDKTSHIQILPNLILIRRMETRRNLIITPAEIENKEARVVVDDVVEVDKSTDKMVKAISKRENRKVL